MPSRPLFRMCGKHTSKKHDPWIQMKPVFVSCFNSGFGDLGENLIRSFEVNAPDCRLEVFNLDDFYGQKEAKYGEDRFNKITLGKLNIIKNSLKKHDFIHFLDADCACLEEPTGTYWDDCYNSDFVFQKDCPCDEPGCTGKNTLHPWLCTGNFTIRNTERAIKMLDDLIWMMGVNYTSNDQECLRFYIRDRGGAVKFSQGKMIAHANDRFVNGHGIKQGLWKGAWIVHANHSVGKESKIELLKSASAWFL